jgi:ElaB/YqjD/DUF883 family membrane-anchored ribosome-binding protein
MRREIPWILILAVGGFFAWGLLGERSTAREEIRILRNEVEALRVEAVRDAAKIAEIEASQAVERARRAEAEAEAGRLRTERDRLRRSLADAIDAIGAASDVEIVEAIGTVVGAAEVSIGESPWRFRLTRLGAERTATRFEEARVFSLVVETYEGETKAMTIAIESLKVELSEETKKTLIERAGREAATDVARRALATIESLERDRRRDRLSSAAIGAAVGAALVAIVSRR